MSVMMALAWATAMAGIGQVEGAEAQGAGRVPRLAFQKYELPNGLDVILHEDHSTPIVTVNLWYHVGSKDERPGRTGFAHLFEHMMFQGSQHYDKDYFGPLQKAGAKLNGSTNPDRTNYWQTVPSNFLELALWMESDRMGFLLPAMTQEKLDNQRDVVKNERRQSYENRPYGLAYEVILAAMFPPEHPYSWPTIGSMADISAASREDVADFFRRYYHPANASLCIAGDFDPQEAKRLVEKYFGPIPAGPPVEKMKSAAVALKETVRVKMTDRVGLSRLYLNWPSVPIFAPDDAELDVLADVLAGGKTSRLYRALVREKQIAQDVQASQNSGEIAGSVSIIATARPGHSLQELETAIFAEIERLQSEPPSAQEVARAVAHFESQTIRALESVSDFGGRADRLNMYNVYTGDPGFLEKDFARYLKVQPADVQRVAKKYLGGHKVVLEVTPGKETTITPDPRVAAEQVRNTLAKTHSLPNLPEPPAIAVDEDRQRLPGPGPTPRFQLPPIHRRQLSNGMQVLVVENHELPSVSIHAVFPAGRFSDPPDKIGLMNLLAAVWDEGTQKRTADEIAEALADVGASLHVSADWDATAARLFTLKHALEKSLDVFADVLQNPSFPTEELERERNIALGRLDQVRNEPMALASMAVAATLYGLDHPYGKPQFGTAKSLRAVTREDLVAFHRDRIRPDQGTLIAVGDVSPDEIAAALENAIGGWKAPGKPSNPTFPALPPKQPSRIILVDKPGAAQSVIAVSLLGAERNSPDYFPLVMMNSIFGGQFSSRLNMNLREDKGYTYGARTLFDWRVHQPGPFVAMAAVQTAVTAPALVEFLKEFDGMVGGRPVDKDELEFNKNFLTRGFPAQFETPGNVASQLETLVQFRLPDDYFNTLVPNILAVTEADVLRVAQKYLDTKHLSAIVVGDRAGIESSLRELPIGKNLTVVHFDDDFRLVP